MFSNKFFFVYQEQKYTSEEFASLGVYFFVFWITKQIPLKVETGKRAETHSCLPWKRLTEICSDM